MTVLFNSSLCAFISFIFFWMPAFSFLFIWSCIHRMLMHCLKVRFIFPIWNESRKMHVFWLILIELSVQVSYIYTAIECMQITETNWWKKIYQLSFRTPLDVLKMLNSRGGANSLSSFFFDIYVYCTTNSNKSFACISSVKMLAHWVWH